MCFPGRKSELISYAERWRVLVHTFNPAALLLSCLLCVSQGVADVQHNLPLYCTAVPALAPTCNLIKVLFMIPNALVCLQHGEIHLG